jgi:hypothetical protein
MELAFPQPGSAGGPKPGRTSFSVKLARVPIHEDFNPESVVRFENAEFDEPGSAVRS